MSFPNNIVIQKIWQESDLLEIKVTCSSDIISATTEVYLATNSLTVLHEKLKHFCDDKIDTFTWTSGEFGDNTTACISFSFSRKDAIGHITIEVIMELDDGAPFSRHKCCFFVHTELGLLYSFLKKLPIMWEQKQEDGCIISLDTDL